MKKSLLTLSILLCASFACWAQDEEDEQINSQIYTQIISAFQTQNWQEVISLIDPLVEKGIDIDDLEVNYDIAISESGNPTKAAERLETYLAKWANDYQGWNALGDAYAKSGKTDLAVNAYENCAKLAPNYAKPSVSMARLLSLTDKAKAVEAYNNAIRIFLLAQQPAGAIQLGSEAIKLEPKNLRLLMQLGDALSMANMTDNALAFYAEAIEVANSIDNPDVEAMQECAYHIASILYKQKKYAESQKFMTDMLTSLSSLRNNREAYTEALCLAAACAYRMGKQSEADSYLALAKGIAPDTAQDLYDGLLSLTE